MFIACIAFSAFRRSFEFRIEQRLLRICVFAYCDYGKQGVQETNGSLTGKPIFPSAVLSIFIFGVPHTCAYAYYAYYVRIRGDEKPARQPLLTHKSRFWSAGLQGGG